MAKSPEIKDRIALAATAYAAWGWTAERIAKSLKVDVRTVRRYVALARKAKPKEDQCESRS